MRIAGNGRGHGVWPEIRIRSDAALLSADPRSRRGAGFCRVFRSRGLFFFGAVSGEVRILGCNDVRRRGFYQVFKQQGAIGGRIGIALDGRG